MPRSSRHKSSHHRQHRRRERSDSDSEEERKQQRSDSEGSERRKVASFLQSPDKKSGSEGRHAGKNVDLYVVGERWSGDGGEERKEEVDGEKAGKVRVLVGEKDKEKERTRYAEKEKERRRDSDEMREKERSGMENFHDKSRDKDAEKERRTEKESERERRTKRGREREREFDRDREVKDVARKKFSDGISKSSGSGGGDREKVKGSIKHGDQQEYNEVQNSDLDKDISRKTRRKDYSGSKDELHEVDKDDCERRLPLMDDWRKYSGVKDEKYAENCKREKYREDYDRKGRTQHDKRQDGRYARDQVDDKPENKHSKEVDKISENHNKKNRIQENGCASSPYFDKYSVKHMDKKDKIRSLDDFYLHNDPKPQDKKENQGMEISMSEVNHGRNKSEKHKFMDTSDNYPKTKHPKTTSQDAKNKYRLIPQKGSSNSLEQVNSTKRELSPEDKIHKDSASLGDLACEKIQRINSASSSESHSLERTITQKEHPLDDFLEQSAASSQNQVTPRSHVHPLPSQLSEKQSSYTGRRHSNRSGEEMKRRISFSNDGRGHSTIEKWRDFSHGRQESANGSLERDLPNGDSLPVSSFSSNRVDHLSTCSASPLRSSSARHGTGSPASGSEGDRFQAGECKHNGRSSRIGDPNFGRGHGNSLKGVFSWPSPIVNGFVPFQHGPPPGGFYHVVQPFPVPPMFGVRPPMDLNQSGIPFYMNEASNRLSGHTRPFGEDPFPPNLQAWEGSNSMFGDGYGNSRSGWEQKNHLTTNHGSEMRKDSMEEQNECLSMQCIDSQKEAVASNLPGYNKQSQTDNIEVKGSQDTQSRIQTDNNGVSVKIPNEHSKLPDNDAAAYFSVYFSNLDISFDLAQPELCHQWNKTVGVKGNIANITTTAPENLEGKVSPRNSSHSGCLFPILSDSIFQRAICLYKKDSGAKAKFLTSNPQSKEVASHASKIYSVAKLSPDTKLGNANLSNTMEEEVNNLPTLQPDAEDLASSKYSDAKEIDCAKEASFNDVHLLENADPSSCMEEDTGNFGTLVADVDVVSPRHTVVKDVDPVEKLSSLDNNLLGNTDPSSRMEGADILSSLRLVDSSDILKDKRSDTICIAGDCAEGSSLGCEVLMPDCRVTLSRIHPPENTH